MSLKHALFMTAAFTLTACAQSKPNVEETQDVVAETPVSVTEAMPTSVASGFDDAKLASILADQPVAVKMRYEYRHPKQTLEFFGIEPGMTVVEALPGGGWYSKILLPYLGENGTLIGVDYAMDMWPHFGGFATAEFLEKKKTWPTEWTGQAIEWRGETGPDVKAFAFGNRDVSIDGTADAALFIRAMHNLNRFSDKDDYIGEALTDMYALLKTGGTLGVVQHRAPEGNSDASCAGSQGYLKQSALIKTIEAAGFEFVERSEINANPKDTPSDSDIVWRLPPSLGTSADDEALKAQMTTIGESDRMTLKFVKR